MTSPMVSVTRDETGDDAMIRVRVGVPGSKFGPVVLVLYEYEAEALAEDILAQLAAPGETELTP